MLKEWDSWFGPMYGIYLQFLIIGNRMIPQLILSTSVFKNESFLSLKNVCMHEGKSISNS